MCRLHYIKNNEKEERSARGYKLALYNLKLSYYYVNIASHESLGTRLRQQWIKLRQWAGFGMISARCLISNQACKYVHNSRQITYM